MGIFIDDDNDHEYDVSKRLEADLQSVISKEIEKEKQGGVVKAPISEEMRKAKILAAESKRVQSRVLFISSDQALRDEGSIQQRTLVDLQEVFAEIHIILLTGVKKKQSGTKRLAKNVWLYEAHSRHLFLLPFAARKVAKEQLVFTDGFRPDIVVALEPFTAGIAAWLLDRTFDRPWQVHLTNEKYLVKEEFIAAHKSNKWRLRMMDFVLKRATSVRVGTEALLQYCQSSYPHLKDLAILPKYFNISQLLTLPKPATSQFPQFKFTLLYQGKLDADSTFYRALDAARDLLRTPSIGLVVIGRGPAKERFMERAKLLGVASQVVWLGEVEDPIPNLQSADVALVTDVDERGDELTIKLAALGVPMIMAKTELREDLFTDGRDVALIDPEDTKGFAGALKQFINTNSLRTQFRENAKAAVRSRIEEDPELYRIALRNSIEKILYLEEMDRQNVEQAAVIKEAQQQAIKKSRQYTTVDGVEMKLPQRAVESDVAEEEKGMKK